VQFWPLNGRARQSLLAPSESEVFKVERPAAVVADDGGGLELF
jgi:hypothetical protein